MRLKWAALAAAGLIVLWAGLSGCAGGAGVGQDAAIASEAPLDRDAQAQQIADEAARLAASRGLVGEPAPDVLWLDQEIGRDSQAGVAPAPIEVEQAQTPVSTEASVWDTVIAPTAPGSMPAGRADAPTQPDKAAAIDQLVKQITAGQGGRLGQALRAASVLAIQSDRELPESIFDGLDPGERQRVLRFHGVVRDLMAALARGDRLDADVLADRLANGLGETPKPADRSIAIGDIELCTSVRGFGVFEPFAKNVFLAGRANKMIIYLELDGFTSRIGADGKHVVRLTQELELYDEGGLVVWRQTPASIVDESRRERRDFFTCQLVELPARLTVGRFYLKARVIDEATGHRAERSVPIEVVADYGLATQPGRDVPLGG
ncbi:MAG: hypothetical protein AAGK09_04765 [Planctomycetota bacterium]